MRKIQWRFWRTHQGNLLVLAKFPTKQNLTSQAKDPPQQRNNMIFLTKPSKPVHVSLKKARLSPSSNSIRRRQSTSAMFPFKPSIWCPEELPARLPWKKNAKSPHFLLNASMVATAAPPRKLVTRSVELLRSGSGSCSQERFLKRCPSWTTLAWGTWPLLN